MYKYSWFSWFLQFCFGAFLGGLAFGSISLRATRYSAGNGMWECFYCGLAFTVGGGLFLGGLSAYYGDRMWMPRGLFDSAVPEKSKAANISALAISVIGVLSSIIALIAIWI